MMTRAEADMGTAILWLALIVLLYPVMLFLWTSDLRTGLRARRAWDRMTPDEQAAALDEQARVQPPPRKGRSRRKAGAT
jgi:hypothetical protein